MDKDRITKEVFEIAMHSLRNEEIFLKQEAMKKYMDSIKEPPTSACATVTYEQDIIRASQSIKQRREWLYELMDKFYEEE